MTSAHALHSYYGTNRKELVEGHTDARKTLKEKLLEYMNENAVYFAGAAAVMSGSQYAFFRYVYPTLVNAFTGEGMNR